MGERLIGLCLYFNDRGQENHGGIKCRVGGFLWPRRVAKTREEISGWKIFALLGDCRLPSSADSVIESRFV